MPLHLTRNETPHVIYVSVPSKVKTAFTKLAQKNEISKWKFQKTLFSDCQKETLFSQH